MHSGKMVHRSPGQIAVTFNQAKQPWCSIVRQMWGWPLAVVEFLTILPLHYFCCLLGRGAMSIYGKGDFLAGAAHLLCPQTRVVGILCSNLLLFCIRCVTWGQSLIKTSTAKWHFLLLFPANEHSYHSLCVRFVYTVTSPSNLPDSPCVEYILLSHHTVW